MFVLHIVAGEWLRGRLVVVVVWVGGSDWTTRGEGREAREYF